MMAWVKLDDHFFRHPKVIAAGRDARDLYLAALCYSGEQLTDGFIPVGALRMLGALADIDDHKQSASKLLEVGLWEATSNGYVIHDFLHYNPAKEKVIATRQARAEAGSLGGVAKSKQNPSKASSKNEAKSCPVPVPVPVPVNDPYPNDGANAPDEPGKPVSRSEPFALLETLCDELGEDVSVLQGSQRTKQLAVAKRLIAAGLSPPDLGRMVHWLQGQSWMTSGIDLFTVEKYLSKWQLAGKPDSVPTRSPNGTRHGPKGPDAKWFADLAKDLERQQS